MMRLGPNLQKTCGDLKKKKSELLRILWILLEFCFNFCEILEGLDVLENQQELALPCHYTLEEQFYIRLLQSPNTTYYL